MQLFTHPMSAVVMVLAVVAAGCANSSTSPADDTASALAAAAVQLITVDNTFGRGDVFAAVYVKPNTDPGAGADTEGAPERPLTADERAAIEAALSAHARVYWLDETDNSDPTSGELSAIVGLGEPILNDINGFVPVSMVCGNLCGTWLTYEVAYRTTEWVTIGIRGPIAIS